MKPALRILLLVLFVGLSATGCRQIQKLLPAKTIDNPDPGSREWVVYKALEAAQIQDTTKSYEALRPLLHSEVTNLSSSESSFRSMNFPAFRRKIDLLVKEPGSPTYLLDYEDKSDGGVEEYRLFVVNKASEMPAPFRVRRDAANNNEWRIITIP